MPYHILVTGGAGYIGSVLVPNLLSAGHKVTVIDNFMYRQNSLAACCANPNFEVVNGDVRSESQMLSLLKEADIIIPLAALVGAPLCAKDPVGAVTTNHDAVISMLGRLSRQQIVLMPTTNSAYGTGATNNFCDEQSDLRPISLYAVEKVKVEKELMEREHSVSFRLATVFGMSPRMRMDLLVNDFTYRALTDRFVVLFESQFKRNYIHITDVSRVFLHAISNLERMCGQIYNVGLSDANLSKWALCEEIKKHVPDFVFLEAPISKDPDQRNYVVSNAKIEAAGFRPAVSLGAGIQELVKGYRMLRNAVYGNI
jgi:nucleoside-diphosphate-sugar epimerase